MKQVNSTFGLKVAILSISFLLMMRMTISPALAEIGKAFPHLSMETLMFMVVFPSLVAIIVGFFAGTVTGIFKTKQILYVALILFLIGGIGPVFVTEFKTMMIFRAILGCGTGLLLPFGTGLIAIFFSGRERNQLIGLQSTAIATGNIITSMLAGLLAAIAWNLSFLIYALAAITLFLVITRIPEPPKAESKEGKTRTVSVNRYVLFICTAILFYAIIYFAFFGYISFVIDGNNLGDAKMSGIATMLMTLAALIIGILFGRVVALMKRFALPFSLLLNVIGFGILGLAANLGQIFVAAIVIGVGFGILMPYATMRLNEEADPASLNFVNGLFMTFVNIGTAAAPKILTTIGRLFDNPDGQFIFLFSACCLAVAMIISLVAALVYKKADLAVAASE